MIAATTCSSEMQRTRMPRRRRTRLRRPQRADLTKCGFHLLDHEIDRAAGLLHLARRGPTERLCWQCGFGATPARALHQIERTPLSSITVARPSTARAMAGSASIAGGASTAARRGWRRRAVNAARYRPRIDRMELSLHQRPFPAFAITRDVIPGEGATHLAAHKGGNLVHVGAVAGVGLEIAEARLTVPP